MAKRQNQQTVNSNSSLLSEDLSATTLVWAEFFIENLKYLLHLVVWWCIVIVSLSALSIKRFVDYGFVKLLATCAWCLENTKNISEENDRCREIMDRKNQEPYLLRYYLLFTDRNKFPFNIFLHKFLQGDDDEDVHDHPWGFFHLILSGGYWEEVPVNTELLSKGMHKVWRKPGYWNVVGADYKHRIELSTEKPWTIFIPFRKRIDGKKWGFWVNDKETAEWKKIPHDKYLGEREQKQTRTGLRVRKKVA